MAKKNAELTFLVAKSPYWQMDFVVEGERVCRSTRTADRKQAERIARAEWQAARDRAAERRKAGDRKDMTLGDAVSSYLAYRGDYASRVDDLRRFDWLTRWIGAGTYLSQVTHEVLVGLVARRRGESRWGRADKGRPSEASVHLDVVATLRKLLTYAQEECGVELPREPRYKRIKLRRKPRIAELMVDQQVKVMRSARRDVLEVADFILETGFRRETALLTWDQVHFAEGVIRVRTKGDVPQEITMTARARAILMRARGNHPVHVFTFVALRNQGTRGGGGYEKGKRYPMTGPYLLRAWRQACREASIEVLRVHDLRKTHGARIVRETGDILAASKSLGHADISMTARAYAHITRKDVGRRVAQTASRTDARIERLLRDEPGGGPEDPVDA